MLLKSFLRKNRYENNGSNFDADLATLNALSKLSACHNVGSNNFRIGCDNHHNGCNHCDNRCDRCNNGCNECDNCRPRVRCCTGPTWAYWPNGPTGPTGLQGFAGSTVQPVIAARVRRDPQDLEPRLALPGLQVLAVRLDWANWGFYLVLCNRL